MHLVRGGEERGYQLQRRRAAARPQAYRRAVVVVLVLVLLLVGGGGLAVLERGLALLHQAIARSS